MCFVSFFVPQIGTSLIVTQFQVLNWTPDGQCSNHVTVARLLNEVLSVQLRTGNKPIIVHCRYFK